MTDILPCTQSGSAVNSEDCCYVRVKRWDVVAVWSWEAQADTCAICKGAIADTCIECRGATGPARSGNCSSVTTGGHGPGFNNNAEDVSNGDISLSSVATMTLSTDARHDSGDLPPSSLAPRLVWGGTVSGDCLIVWGACNHVFHHHCVSRWVRRRPLCPVCGATWKVSKTACNDC
ncbi:Ring finger domain [Trypanosoma vivax]|uniref:RING-type domain-containing protein n=1 Tax=Trypanosoma vivax (strain Y486) TaxID=1055687 RepID=G0TW00_TRYVY|nr:hypothetical protein TRVL_03032 [Trypanosoma vivax]KAH8606919.1 Ring finger domain [Trypanosoma vivax]CCC48116.1 conserved hypothetical protein [Trypanosoma vivax Y486]